MHEMHEPQWSQLNHHSPAEHGWLIFLGGPLNCIGQRTISILLLVSLSCDVLEIITGVLIPKSSTNNPNISFQNLKKRKYMTPPDSVSLKCQLFEHNIHSQMEKGLTLCISQAFFLKCVYQIKDKTNDTYVKTLKPTCYWKYVIV